VIRTALTAAALALAIGIGTAAAEGPVPAACPPGLPADVTCLRGRDVNGSHLLLARPGNWNGGLVVHVFGGPRMAPPAVDTTDEDLVRYQEFLREGWAWVSTSRRRAGFGVTRAGEDTELARRAAVDAYGQPAMTVLHGQSWGGAVAAKAIEAMNAPDADGRRPYDAALLTSGVLAGPTRAYDMRVDLRAAFQAVCNSHPAPEEPQYPVTLGLAGGQSMTREEVVARYLACTGADLRPEARNPAQRAALSDLSAASRIPEWALPGHLWWATQVFADISRNMTEGRSAFGNAGVRYSGTSDDERFNARVPRYQADADARARLAADGDLTGRVAVPVMTLHGIGDATVFVENAAAYRETLERAGATDRLLQVFVDDSEHSKMSAALYPAALAVLRDWAESGRRPNVDEVRARCEAMREPYGGDCRVLPDYVPQGWYERVNPRGTEMQASRR
jgi:alpha-beta hydrolase superfamily lysophospholipase